MSDGISSEQAEIINEFLQESRDMLDNLEPTIIELGQSCQNVDCWQAMTCGNGDCSRHNQNIDHPCWLHTGFLEQGQQSCIHCSSAEDCRSCEVFKSINGSGETMNAIFRLFHSMKGSAGFLELDNIARVAHHAESLLDLIRAGKVKMQPEHVSHLCKACDFSREAMEMVEADLNDHAMAEAADAIAASLELAASEALALAAIEPVVAEETVASQAPTAELSAEDELALLIGPEMVEKFVQEADELLQNVEEGLLAWNEAALDEETMGALFRSAHSFKGNCGFFGYRHMEQLSHQVETVLDLVKSGGTLHGEAPADVLLECLDFLRSAVVDISQGGLGEIDDLDGELAKLEALITGEAPVFEEKEAPLLGQILVEKGLVDAETVDQALQTQGRPLGEILVDQGIASEEQVRQALDSQNKPLGQVLVDMGKAETKAVDEALKVQQKAAPQKEAKPKQSAVVRQDIRVDLRKLDDLINLIGEMVIAENMLVRSPDLEGLELDNFGKASQHLSKIVRDLQEMAMIIRMIPVSGLFRRMIRLVHDLSVKSGKKVDLQLFGQETEVDKTVVEQISDPLVHLLRNSLDHGLETPTERVAAGKPEKGVVKLSAQHQEGEVWIIVEDDGRGLNREKILSKAVSKGLVAGDGSQLSDKDVFNLIFHAGFSTAEKITDVSGRGVGMDVVKQNLEKIKGKIEVTSKLGQGTRITLRIPLTLAIIDGMLVRVGETKCILPLLSIREIFRPTPDAITVMPDGLELVRVRDCFYPVKHLYKILQDKPDSEQVVDGVLVVLEHQDNTICLLVDEIVGQQQTVIKGLTEYIGNVGVASGCTILGNGEVCLILDVGHLTEGAGRARQLQKQTA